MGDIVYSVQTAMKVFVQNKLYHVTGLVMVTMIIMIMIMILVTMIIMIMMLV